ncbi:MAG: protein kinase [Acidobacteriota bacterium]
MKYCKNCRRFVSVEDEFCPYCGSADPGEINVPLDEVEPDTGARILGEKISFNGKDYVARRTIGIGGYGLILEVESEECSSPLAMKVPAALEQFFNPGKDYSQREIENSEKSIESETSVFNKIRSDRVIKVHETGRAFCYPKGTEKDFPAILMELAICTLRDIVLLEAMGKIEISPAEKLKMTSCIINTIEDLHGSGIIHRDIALENIFVVDRNGSIEYVMADFGTSREKNRNSNEKTTGVVGRDKYLDPMRFDRRYRRDPRIDIFTAGIVITEIFIGNLWDNIIYEPLYDIDFEREFLNNYASGQIDKKIIKFISKALKSDITKRYKNISEMKKKFGAMVSKMVKTAGSKKILRTIDLVYNIPVPLKDTSNGDDIMIDFENHKKISLDIDRRMIVRIGPVKINSVNLRGSPFLRASYEGRNILIEADKKKVERELGFFKKEKYREDKGILYFTGKLEIEIKTGILYPEEMWKN